MKRGGRVWILTIITLLMLATSTSAFLMYEGESKTFGDDERVLKLVVVSDRSEKAIFSWNNELSKHLSQREKHRFGDGSLLAVGDIFVDEAQDNPDMVEVYFGTGGPSFSAHTGASNIKLRTMDFDLGGAIENLFNKIWEDDTQPTSFFVTEVDKCQEDKDCFDGNGCTIDSCVGSPAECRYATQEGCPLNNKCLSIGSSLSIEEEQFYCDPNSEWQLRKDDDAQCEENFQCKSSVCDNGVCVTPITIASVQEPVQVEEPKPLKLWQQLLGAFGLM